MLKKVLVVDDEREMLSILKYPLEREGYEVDTALSGEDAWAAMSETVYDCVVADLAMEPMDGLTLLRNVHAVDSLLPFIIMTGAGSIDTAVEAIKLGAYHYITKPFDTQELVLLVNRAVEHGHLHRTLRTLPNVEEDDPEALIIGNSTMMRQMLQIVDKVSESDASILIQGETGTGKSLFARRIHNSSSRRDMPFYTIDCGTLVEQLLESELFGHVKGAFTGAICAKRGLLEEARGGTVFLDEIGELTPSTQVKLLRAIQEKEIKPVGGNTPISIDVRFLAATSRNLEAEAAIGTFRKDLYYRLAVIPVHLPPLRERRDDLLLLVQHFVRKFNTRYRKDVNEIQPSVMQVLLDSPWEGNIRELENIIERAVLLTNGPAIALDSLCLHIPASDSDADNLENAVPLKRIMENTELEAIRQALAIAMGNKTKAAQILGISRRTLYTKLESYNL